MHIHISITGIYYVYTLHYHHCLLGRGKKVGGGEVKPFCVENWKMTHTLFMNLYALYKYFRYLPQINSKILTMARSVSLYTNKFQLQYLLANCAF